MRLKKESGRCKKSLISSSFFSNQNRIVTFHSEPKLTPRLALLQLMNIEDLWRGILERQGESLQIVNMEDLWRGDPRKAGRVLANC